jgi:hypothetical protein
MQGCDEFEVGPRDLTLAVVSSTTNTASASPRWLLT